MDQLRLLKAVNTKGVHTTEAVTDELGMSGAEALAALRAAEQAGLVVEDEDQSINNVPPGFNRQYWHLTQAGLDAMYRLEDAAHSEQ